MTRIRIWDLPLRLFHWTLVVLVAASIITIKLGGNWVEWHFRCGYAILSLLLFRIVWGLAGPRYARFAHFLKSPREILGYVRTLNSRTSAPAPGHNPLGGLAVAALLAVLLLQATSGLFSNDDVVNEGPLVALISKQTSDLVSEVHSTNAYAVYALLVLHILAIGFYRWRLKRNLLLAMITGSLVLPEGAVANTPPWIAVRDGLALWLRAALVLAACAALVWLIVAHTQPPAAG